MTTQTLHLTREKIEGFRARCTLCRTVDRDGNTREGTGWIYEADGPRPCMCLQYLWLYDRVGSEIFQYGRLGRADERLTLRGSYRLTGPWPHVAGRLFAVAFEASWGQPPVKLVTDLDVRRASLARNPREDEVDRGLDPLVEHPGLVLLRLGFSVSKNSEAAAYVAEFLTLRGPRAVWVHDPGLKHSDVLAEALERLTVVEVCE